MKPLIGITPAPQYHRPYGDIYAMATTYVGAVEAAGGVPVVLPPHRAGVEESVAILDGLLLSGGGDIAPARYGDREVHPQTYGISELRDEFEFALLEAALARDLPLLAICRGIQVLNVGLGGTLYQDVADQYPGARAHRQQLTPETRHDPSHTVASATGSLLAEVYGPAPIAANSFHHQTVKEVGRGLEVAGRAEDGSIEAVELPARRFVLGVQWHPEMMYAEHPAHLRPFARLVAEAAAFRERRALGAAHGGG